MAKDWKTAQNKEKEFWTNIYLSEKKDNIYNKTDARGWILFAEDVLTRNNLKKEFFSLTNVMGIGIVKVTNGQVRLYQIILINSFFSIFVI